VPEEAAPTAQPFTLPVERGKVREFAAATGSASDDYLTEPHPVIPPTFLRTTLFWSPPGSGLLPEGIELDLRRILHGEQEYTFFGPPPRAGATLTVTPRVESVTTKQGKRGGEMLIVVTVEDFTDEDGKLVAQGRSTLIQTGKAPE
jgi:N-terminal half of MaoC dehydratase